jgi:hypothetical protein
MSANDGPGGEPTRRSAVPSPSPPDRDDVLVPSSFGVAPPTATAIVGGCHRSLVIIPLSRTVTVVVLVLLLLPERTPIPDRDSRPTRATYVVNDGQASIHARGLSSSSARHRGRPASIHPLPPSAPRQYRRRDSRHVRRPLEVACVRTSVLPSFYALFDFFRVGIAMILHPCRWRSDSPHPRPNPIPKGGGRRNPGVAKFRLVPFEGGLKLVPDPVGNLGGAPSRHRCRRRRRRRRRHHRHRRRDSRLDVVLARRSTHHARPCRRRRCSRGGGGRTLRSGGGRGSSAGRSGRSSSPTPPSWWQEPTIWHMTYDMAYDVAKVLSYSDTLFP